MSPCDERCTVHHWEAEHVPVHAIRPGDYLDLEGDDYATRCAHGADCPDPAAHESTRIMLENEYAVVAATEAETADCIVLHFENVESMGFPPHHKVARTGHDTRYDDEEEA